jgi:hypothetical protein
VGGSTLASWHPRRQGGTTWTFAVLIAAQWRNAQCRSTGADRAAAVNPGPLLRAQLLSRHRPLRPERLSPAVLPGPAPPRTEPSVTRRSCAIWLMTSPRANRPAACSRSRSRRCCSAGVSRPVAHTTCPGHTPAASRRHDLSSTSSVWLSHFVGSREYVATL